MSEYKSVCEKWAMKSAKPSCQVDCFHAHNGRCPDFVVDLETTQPHELPKPTDPVRRLIGINIQDECKKRAAFTTFNNDDRDCSLRGLQNTVGWRDLCTRECRPLKTSLHLNEWTRRPQPKPTYKHSVWLDPNTVVGRCFPMKYRVRRLKNKCQDCGRAALLRDPIADNTGLMILSDCCDIEIYDRKKLETMHRVRVLTITGKDNMRRRTIEQCNINTIKDPSKCPDI